MSKFWPWSKFHQQAREIAFYKKQVRMLQLDIQSMAMDWKELGLTEDQRHRLGAIQRASDNRQMEWNVSGSRHDG